MKKFVFIGPESTGKTTLCKYIAQHFSTCWVPEMCRIMAEERPQTSHEINFNFTLDDFVEMIDRQNKEEQKLELCANNILICDNDSFAITIWCERYLGNYYNFCKVNVDNKIYILTKPTVPFVQDGYRDGEHIREWMFNRFIEKLEKNQLHYYIIDSSNYDERLKSAIEIIKNNMEYI